MSVYVCSDLHGQINKFNKMLKIVEFSENDILYILGDIVDRGPAPIPLLMQIIDMNNVKCLLGNHEWMMFNAIVKNHDKSLWFRNGGSITSQQFNKLSVLDKDIIIDYIMSMQIVIPDFLICSQNKERHFYLSHASYIDDNIPENNNIKTLIKNIDYIETAVWNRLYPINNIWELKHYDLFKGKTLIVGHTPTGNIVSPSSYQKILHSNKNHYIDIDCGCAGIPRGNLSGRLGCLRLDDMKEFYF